MADKNASRTQHAQQDVQGVVVDDSRATPSYTNFCRVNATPEEVILDFGLNSEPANPGYAIPIAHRIVCNFYTAKRLLMVLGAALERHEDTFGELEIDVNKRVKSK